jgi:esterase/lipase
LGECKRRWREIRDSFAGSNERDNFETIPSTVLALPYGARGTFILSASMKGSASEVVVTGILSYVVFAAALSGAVSQDLPADYKQALTALERTGDFKDGVLKVNTAT